MRKILSLLVCLLVLISCSNSSGSGAAATAQCTGSSAPDYLYKAEGDYIKLLRTSDCSYQPLFIKGINLGVAKPGKYAGDLETAASYNDFMRWFQLMVDAGINVVRVYTLHMDFFYDAVHDFNTAREASGKSPLYVMHGIWLDENSPAVDLYTVTSNFSTNINEVVNAVHGNITLDYVGRPGKGYGIYTANIQKWVIGWIIGREVHPDEIALTNSNNSSINSYSGTVLSLPSGSPSEAWITARMDEVLAYEKQQYTKQRPISFSSWPTLDPLSHSTEISGSGYEDSEKVDLANIDISSAAAGVFYSFHAYPYYPDFISEDTAYRTWTDADGANSYKGYLAALRNHYSGRPVLIAEFSVPSSWGNVHSSHSGMHHGGHDETAQGNYGARMLQNIADVEMGGGMLFAWIDEWWKPTWLTNEFDFPFSRRAYWHNIMAPEQNYGLLGFKPDTPAYTNLTWSGTNITSVKAAADTSFYRLQLGLAASLTTSDEILIALDTYDDSTTPAKLGETKITSNESSYITGGSPVNTAQGSEFLLRIYYASGNWQAQLYVGQDYDLYGLYGSEHTSNLRSPTTPTNTWGKVVWKTNYTDYSGVSYSSFYASQTNYEFQAGQLRVRPVGGSVSSKDAVIIQANQVEVLLPWALLQFTDPAQHKVFHDDASTPSTWQDAYITLGIAQAVVFNGVLEGESSRYLWNKWFTNPAANPQTEPMPAYSEVIKQSYYVYKEAIATIGN
ncbi:MAG: hypothetical protein OEY52_02475 [Gammaproteobacteria bacterium]|nr:hypothetical protein [Gammaproteobacteria bacterium]